jgi:hypothetical protein
MVSKINPLVITIDIMVNPDPSSTISASIEVIILSVSPIPPTEKKAKIQANTLQAVLFIIHFLADYISFRTFKSTNSTAIPIK